MNKFWLIFFTFVAINCNSSRKIKTHSTIKDDSGFKYLELKIKNVSKNTLMFPVALHFNGNQNDGCNGKLWLYKKNNNFKYDTISQTGWNSSPTVNLESYTQDCLEIEKVKPNKSKYYRIPISYFYFINFHDTFMFKIWLNEFNYDLSNLKFKYEINFKTKKVKKI